MFHVSRLWPGMGSDKERFSECICEQAPCGLVSPHQNCYHHGGKYARTMRQGHPANECPGKEAE